MTKYLLIVIGNVSEDDCPDIVLAMSDIIDSENVKFLHNPNSFMVCFESSVEKSNIFCYLRDILFDISDIYILSVIDDDSTVSIPKSVREFIFDLNSAGEFTINLAKQDYDEDDDDNELIELLRQRMGKEYQKPSLDFLLDKISQKGLNSLTQFEKQSLESYSKN